MAAIIGTEHVVPLPRPAADTARPTRVRAPRTAGRSPVRRMLRSTAALATWLNPLAPVVLVVRLLADQDDRGR